MIINKVTILPTGNEISEGIVVDTDSGAVMTEILKINPRAHIVRCAPIVDEEACISNELNKEAGNSDLVILIGGSGGGHRYSKTLGKDYTHTSLAAMLEECYATSLYGKNGHLWCRLIAGKLKGAVVINLPGPYDEATAAIAAFCNVVSSMGNSVELNADFFKAVNKAMASAVELQYKRREV